MKTCKDCKYFEEGEYEDYGFCAWGLKHKGVLPIWTKYKMGVFITEGGENCNAFKEHSSD